ncbi:hypothetical protein EB796_001120 [Bugula neritina]|uniref:Uncharacterized protein n=1 Tax=Bugula neritina TaxID=10212 RepID=A0A7J7KQW6_BUGNE|nr:hypothetical protein EB796_001120 [Bugula neritina]
MFILTLEKQVHKQPSYVFPVIDWDLLPPGGASQYHPHLQVMLTPDRYPGNECVDTILCSQLTNAHNHK